MSDPIYRENYIESLRSELVDLVARKLTPVALRYGYSEVPLESTIKWRPQVLVLGNYSSGKSTLINELLGCSAGNGDIQATGQAPTDDSFTVITCDETEGSDDGGVVRVTEEREGKVLLNDPQYPFEVLKKHGQRFAAHFRLKKVNSPFLRHMAIIDTPGMLDSIAERDRGYNYQEVIGDLAQIADLVLVLFDPHKAGTVREAYASLRETLPANTFEDRVIFVLNRVDECETLVDLLRVYGTLCWNLSQMLGRKDIPMIRLTYSQVHYEKTQQSPPEYLRYLNNQREELKAQIFQAPKYRLDHLADYVETHGERLLHLLEALLSYKHRRTRQRTKLIMAAALVSLILGLGAGGALMPLVGVTTEVAVGAGVALFGGLLGLFTFLILPRLMASHHKRQLGAVDDLTPLNSQSRRDSWQAVQELVLTQLAKQGSSLQVRELKTEHAAVRRVCDKGSKDIRGALNELATVRH